LVTFGYVQRQMTAVDRRTDLKYDDVSEKCADEADWAPAPSSAGKRRPPNSL